MCIFFYLSPKQYTDIGKVPNMGYNNIFMNIIWMSSKHDYHNLYKKDYA